jgi:pimeloyl-ACP methyl ester carboxylesterase
MDGLATLRSEFIAALAPDLTGTIVAYPVDRPLAYAELESLARAQIPQQPFVLVGESFSGPIAISLAAAGPPGLCGLVLVASFAQCPRPVPRWLRALAALLPVWLIPTRWTTTFLLGGQAAAALRSRFAAAIATVSPRVWRARLRSVLFSDMATQLSKVSVPIMYLRATHDRVVQRRVSLMISQAAPGLRIVDVAGPHCLLLVNPRESAAHVKQFVREISFVF